MGVIFVDEAVELTVGLYLLGMAGVLIASWVYFMGRWPERWVFPLQGFIGLCFQAGAWTVLRVQHSVWWWTFLIITGIVTVVVGAVGVAFAFRHRQFASSRIADALLMLGGLCQLAAIAIWLGAHFFA